MNDDMKIRIGIAIAVVIFALIMLSIGGAI